MNSALSGKVAWVTGAGSGIGQAVAVCLAQEGCKVVLSGRRQSPLHQVAGQVEAIGAEALVLAGDLGQPGVATKIATEIDATFGRIDILVNNAGSNIVERSWDKLNEDGFQELLSGNLTASFLSVMAALPFMRAARSGSIITTASLAGWTISAQPGPAYTAAKHAVRAMSHTINLEEFQNGIRATAICPGEVATPLVEKRAAPPDPKALTKMLLPMDVAGLVVYAAKLPDRACVTELVVVPTGFDQARR